MHDWIKPSTRALAVGEINGPLYSHHLNPKSQTRGGRLTRTDLHPAQNRHLL